MSFSCETRKAVYSCTLLIKQHRGGFVWMYCSHAKGFRRQTSDKMENRKRSSNSLFLEKIRKATSRQFDGSCMNVTRLKNHYSCKRQMARIHFFFCLHAYAAVCLTKLAYLQLLPMVPFFESNSLFHELKQQNIVREIRTEWALSFMFCLDV